MTPNPNPPGPPNPNPGPGSTPPGSASLEDLRKILADLLDAQRQKNVWDQQMQQAREAKEEQNAKPQFWRGAKRALNATGSTSGRQIAGAIGQVEEFYSGVKEMVDRIRGLFTSKAQDPTWAGKPSDLPWPGRASASPPPPTAPAPGRGPGRPPGRVPRVRPMPRPGMPFRPAPARGLPRPGRGSGGPPLPPLPPLGPQAKAWLNPPIIPPTGTPPTRPLPALGWAPPPPIATGGAVGAAAGYGPPGVPGNLEGMLQQQLTTQQQILAVVQKMAQGEDDTSFDEREVDRDDFGLPSGSTARAEGGHGGASGLGWSGGGKAGGPDKPPAKEPDIFDKAGDWLSPGNKELGKIIMGLL